MRNLPEEITAYLKNGAKIRLLMSLLVDGLKRTVGQRKLDKKRRPAPKHRPSQQKHQFIA